MKEKISIIGVGRLGLCFALLLDSKGYDVCGCDVNEDYIESLKNKTFQSDEPQVNEMLTKCKINFTTNSTDAFNHSSLIYIFVPTPSKESGEYDHRHIEQVIEEFIKADQRFKTIVIGCTVMPGYCSSLEATLSPFRVIVIYQPSFIAQGSICNNIKYSDIVLVGGKRPMLLQNIYTDIMEKSPNFKQLTLTGAEIAKISINCFLTAKISFANMVGEIAINSGETEVMVDAILETVGSDSRIGNKFMGYGFSYGGVCFPRDNKALNYHAASVGIDTRLPADIDSENKRHAEYLKNYWIKKNPDKAVPFLFSYLGYKKGVNIITESYQFKLCLDLLREGYTVIIPEAVTKMDIPAEFKKYCLSDRVLFEETNNSIHIN